MGQSAQKHFLSTDQFSTEEISFFLNVAKKFSKTGNDSELPKLLDGKNIFHLFFENSTRTQRSFEVAAAKLGGKTTSFSISTSSIAKGESLPDTLEVIKSLGASAIVVRHPKSGAAHYFSKHTDLPVVNAGDGMHAHPTQALLDAFTLQEKWGDLKNKKILILGDILHSRVARSNIDLFTRMGAKVKCCGPSSLLPKSESWQNFEVTDQLDSCLEQMDAIYILRIQKERHLTQKIPSFSEYRKFWGITTERLKKIPKNTFILHPGPVNLGIELDDYNVNGENDPRFLINRQVQNGISIRMAALSWVLCREKLKNEI